MRGTGPQSWQLDRRAAGDRATRTRARRLGRRLASRGGTLLLTAVMVVTVLPAQAWAIPGPGMSREAIEVDLPDIPDAERVGQDESAESDLTTADEVPVVPYEPQAVTPWESGDGTVDLTGVAAGETLPVDDLPVALGVPSDGDPADLAGSWAVGLAAPEASQAAGVAGLIMKITPPATADPAAEVALTVDYTTFADLYGPQAADRFGFLLLPECVYDAPDSGDCATADGSTGRSAGPQAGGAGITGTGEFTPAPSQVSVASTRRVVRGTVPVSALLAGDLTAATSDLGHNLATVWWRWTAPSSGVLDVHRVGSGSVYPAIYRQLPDESYELVSAWGSGATAYCLEGAEFWIQGRGDPWDGVFEMDLRFAAARDNDAFDQAAPLVPGTVPYDFHHAGQEPGEPAELDDASLWWTWTAPAAGVVRIITPHEVAGRLYEGDELATIAEVETLTSGTRYRVSAGVVYRLVLLDWLSLSSEWAVGEFEFRFTPLSTGNDDFADAVDLGSAWSASGATDTVGATLEPGEPSEHAASLWWRWVAPADAVVYLTATIANSGGNLSHYTVGTVYEGPSVDALGDPMLPRTSLQRWFPVEAGRVYHIALRGPDEGGGPVDFELRAFPSPPPNDDFADATDLGSVASHEEALSFVGATTETGEPDHDPTGHEYVDRTRWWSWTAPADLNVELELDRTFDNLIGVLEGDTLEELVLLARVISGSDAFLRFPAVAGRTYRIVLAGGEDQTEFRLRSFEVPAGDRFAEPVDLGSGLTFDLRGDLTRATLESGEPAPYSPSMVSRWWRWTAPGEGLFEFSGSTAYGSWRLFQGDSLEGLVEVTERSLRLAGGEEFLVLYQGYEQSVGSARLDFSPKPANDDLAQATELGSEAVFEVEGVAYGSTVEVGEPDEFGLLAGGSKPGTQWWAWTAPFSGILRLDGDVPTWMDAEFLAVFEGDEPLSETPVAATQSGSLFLEFPVTGGRSYRIQTGVGELGSKRPGDEWVRLGFALRSAPGNDTLESAYDLGNSDQGEGSGDLTGAFREPFEGGGVSGGSIWWKWTAPRDGTAHAMADATTGSEVLEVYEFDGLGELQKRSPVPFQVPNGSTGVGWAAATGVTYYLAVSGTSSGGPRPVGVRVVMSDPPANDLFAGALDLGAGPGLRIEGSTLGALVEAEELSWTPQPTATAWYSWTAAADGLVALAVESAQGTRVQAFTGSSPDSLVPLAGEAGTRIGWLAEAGTRYWIAVLETDGAWGSFELSLDALEPVANDAFADRLPLAGELPLGRTIHNLGATAEAGEPPHAGGAAAHSVWYEWVAPSDGGLEVVVGSAMRVAAYTGDTLPSLIERASGVGRIAFPVGAGVSYRIAIDGGPGGPGVTGLELRTVATPPNNDLADRTVIEGYEVPLRGDLQWADRETGEPGTSGVYPFHSLWWEWTAPSRDRIAWVQRSGPPPWINVHTSSDGSGSMASLRLLASRPSSFRPSPGQTYYFQIGTASEASVGVLDLVLRNLDNPTVAISSEGPLNDHFADRVPMGSALPARGGADPLGATLEEGEPYRSSRYGSLWWSWTAPSTGTFALRSTSVDGSLVRIYRGTLAGGLTLVDSARESWSLFPAEAGVEYAVGVYAEGFDAAGPHARGERMVAFEIDAGPGEAPNDDFASRIDLGAVATVEVGGSNVGATAEPGEPAHAGTDAARSVWWSWTSPATATFRIEAVGALMRVGVYQGTSPAALVEVASGDDPLELEAQAGVEYVLALDAGGLREFTLKIGEVVIEPPPADAPNDDFAAAIVRTESFWSGRVSNFGSTLEDGEPLHAGDSSQSGSVWWNWTAPADAPVTVAVSNGLSTYVSIYLGDAPGSLVPVTYGLGSVRFRAVAGTTYRVAVSGTSTTAFGEFDLEIDQQSAAPANDDFADAELLEGSGVMVAGTNDGASLERFEPRHHPDNGTCPASVWYRWTSPASDLFRTEVSGIGGDCVAVYRGTWGALEPVLRTRSADNFAASVAETYWIAVAGSYTAGAFELSLQQVGFPDNDDFADRLVLPDGVGARGGGSTLYATLEAGEPDHGSSYIDGSSWWSWTATEDGLVTLDFRDSPERGWVVVYTGSELGSLVEVADGGGETLEFRAVAGTTYQIAVSWSLPSNAGDIEFTVLGGGPVNDAFSGRIELPAGLPAATAVWNIGATEQLGDPTVEGVALKRTLWWTWRAEAEGWVDLDFRASAGSVEAGLFTGPAPGLLEELDGLGVGERVRRFHVEAGRTYWILAGTHTGSTTGLVELELRPAEPVPVNDAIADAIGLVGQEIAASGDTLGAGLEAGDPVAGEDGFWHRTLWWRWTAPRSGVAWLDAVAGGAFLYRIGPEGLVAAERLPGDQDGYRVVEGVEHFIAAASGEAGPVGWTLAMGPAGDLAAYPMALGGTEFLRLSGSLERASWEAVEPFHAGLPAERSLWYEWTAPYTARFRVRVSAPFASFRVVVYEGSPLGALSPRAEGEGEVSLEARGGVTYRLVVDTDALVGDDDFELELQAEPEAYRAWRDGFFGGGDSPESMPGADPDRDGWPNAVEQAFLGNPRVAEAGLVELVLDPGGEAVALELRRPWNHPAGLRVVPEVSRGLGGWQPIDALNRIESQDDLGGGWSRYRAVLSDFEAALEPRLHGRVRVDFPAGEE